MMRVLSHYLAGEGADDVYIYGHDEVIGLLKNMAEKLLQKNEVRSLDGKLHLVAVEDGETKTVLGHPVTFFDIHSTKAKQFGFCMDLGDGKKLTCCGDEPYNDCEEKYAMDSTWLLTKPSACTPRQTSSPRMRSTTPQLRMPVSWQRNCMSKI